MVFNSHQMQVLLSKYTDVPDFLAPGIVQLCRNKRLEGERILLDKIISEVPEFIRKDWVRRLLNKEKGLFLGAWFEVMLFGWLAQLGRVTPSPDLVGLKPDFLLETINEKVIIEAKVFLKPEKDRNEELWITELYVALHQIHLNYIVEFEDVRMVAKPDTNDFIERVKGWLTTAPHETCIFQDKFQNSLKLKVFMQSAFDHVTFVNSSGKFLVNPEISKKGLGKKAGKYKQIIQEGYKYVIACFFEDPRQSSHDLISALFGRTQVFIDRNKSKIFNYQTDNSGIHYFGNSVHYKIHNGILLFNDDYNEKEKSRFLSAISYIQNPYSETFLDHKIFPARSSFIVKNSTQDCIEMGWENSLS